MHILYKVVECSIRVFIEVLTNNSGRVIIPITPLLSLLVNVPILNICSISKMCCSNNLSYIHKGMKNLAIFTCCEESYGFWDSCHVVPDGKITQKQLRYSLLSEVHAKLSQVLNLLCVMIKCNSFFRQCSQLYYHTAL